MMISYNNKRLILEEFILFLHLQFNSKSKIMKTMLVLLFLTFTIQSFTYPQSGDSNKQISPGDFIDTPPGYGRGTTTGKILQRITTSERNNIASPPANLIIFNITTNRIEEYVNGKWQLVSQTPFTCGIILTDSRDNQNYFTEQIGTQCWMKQNLNIGTMIKGKTEQSNNEIIEKYCYNDIADSCGIYGGLYQWNEMMQYQTKEKAQGICPYAWHVPSDDEWQTLVDFMGGDNKAGSTLKESGIKHWSSTPVTGTSNESGFTGLPAGYRIRSGAFDGLKDYGNWWTSTAIGETSSWSRGMNNYRANVYHHYSNPKNGFSLRCIQD